MILKTIGKLLLIVSFVLCVACDSSSDSTHLPSELQTDSSFSINNAVPLKPCFESFFTYNTFSEINKDLHKKGTDAFYKVIPENLGGLIPLTENNSSERKDELKTAFSGYTYVPKYGDSNAIIVSTLQMEIPSSACFDEYYSENYQSKFELDTRFMYLVRVETPDGDGSNYACVYITQNNDCVPKRIKSWEKDKSSVKKFSVDGKSVEGIVKNNGLSIELLADSHTVITMSFDINLKEPYSFNNINSDRHLREISQEFYSGEWLSKISFEKINLWDDSGYENLKYESSVTIPYETS